MNEEGQHDFVINFADLDNLQEHFAAFGKFNGITQQVKQDLPKPRRIAQEVGGRAFFNAVAEVQPLASCGCRHQIDCVSNGLPQIKIDLFKGHLASLDFRKIENVIDNQ